MTVTFCKKTAEIEFFENVEIYYILELQWSDTLKKPSLFSLQDQALLISQKMAFLSHPMFNMWTLRGNVFMQSPVQWKGR